MLGCSTKWKLLYSIYVFKVLPLFTKQFHKYFFLLSLSLCEQKGSRTKCYFGNLTKGEVGEAFCLFVCLFVCFKCCFVSLYFDIAGVVDLLTLLKNVDSIDGVDRSQQRSSAFILDGTANINVPTTRFFHENYFPSEFSILVTAKPSPDNAGYILTLSDIMGFVKIGVQVGLDPNFEYGNLSRSNKGHRSLKFRTDLSDGSWHQFSYSVTRSEVSLYVDCSHIDTAELNPSLDYDIGTNSVISIGKSFFESRKYPRYEVSVWYELKVSKKFAMTFSITGSNYPR